MMYNIDKIRSCFPILNQQVYNKPLVYFDTAASAQKPIQVIELQEKLHKEYYGNIHRAAHFLADKTTIKFEAVRDRIMNFAGAADRSEIIFTKGTTESANLVASSFGEKYVGQDDEIIVSEMEHHSNIVPWQMLAQRKKAKVVVLPFSDNGVLEIEKLESLISSKTKILAVAHVSNVLGTINPVSEIVEIAHKHNVPVFVDGAQAVQHMPVDIKKIDADFYAFSAHKMYGPNGVGVLIGKKKWLEEMPPYQGGGEMVSEVSFEKTVYNELPFKFEAGTPNITGVIAMEAAIDLLEETGLNHISEWEEELLAYATKELSHIEGLKIYGNAPRKSGVISFNIEDIHPYDLGMLLDKMGIAVRTGHHCAGPVMKHYDLPGTVRASFGMYNTKNEISMFVEALHKIRKMF